MTLFFSRFKLQTADAELLTKETEKIFHKNVTKCTLSLVVVSKISL